MKLAEALIQRADYQRRVEQLKQRIINNAKVQEGDEPAEDPNVLLAEMERITAQLVELVQRINRTNSATVLGPDDMTIADAIAERDNLRLRQGVYKSAAEAAVIRQDRYSKSEVRFQSTVNVADMQQQADDLAQAIRELDTRIQEANWKIDLL
ncbi:MAG: DIP1984 family protein [Candidatus Promineifilaceae bacterium]|jgi:hypothetical protein